MDESILFFSCGLQADISLIKILRFTFDTILNKNEVIGITGVTNETVFSLGTICTNLIFSIQLISHIFHVAADDLNISVDGILGI